MLLAQWGQQGLPVRKESKVSRALLAPRVFRVYRVHRVKRE